MSPLRKQGTGTKKLDSRWRLSRTQFTPHFDAGMRVGMTNMDKYASNRRTVSATGTKENLFGSCFVTDIAGILIKYRLYRL